MVTKRKSILTLAERGMSVRVYYRAGVSTLQLEIDERVPGKKPRKMRRSFGHADEAAAKSEAHEVFGDLLKRTPIQRQRGELVTLGDVVERYEASASFRAVTERVQHDRTTALKLLLGFNSWRVLPVAHFGQEELLHYAEARTTGTYRCEGGHDTVSARRAQAELQILRTALNWGYTTKVAGKRIVPDRVFDGLTIPSGNAPIQPSVTEAEFGKLWATRYQMHPEFTPALALAYVYGKRGNSIRNLKWSEIDFEKPSIYWNPEHDKEDQVGEFWVPEDVAGLLKTWFDDPHRPASEWVFAAPKNPDMPVSRVSFYQWICLAYRKAGIQKPRQAGWHSFRRAFTTRNHTDAKAAMKLAGMRNLSTFNRYQQPEDADVKRVLMNRQPLQQGTVRDTNVPSVSYGLTEVQ